MYNKHALCENCGVLGHKYKECRAPRTSFGVINIRIDDDEYDVKSRICAKYCANTTKKITVESAKFPDITCTIVDDYAVICGNRQHDIQDSNINTHDDARKALFAYYKDRIKFMMISRKYSLGFIEFIRGKYNIYDIAQIIKLFRQMYPDEIEIIKQKNYDDILYYYLGNNAQTRQTFLENIYEGSHSKEYCEAKVKFQKLAAVNAADVDLVLGLDYYANNIAPYSTNVEWGFPKGRRNNNQESNVECAAREFCEETGYDSTEFQILDNISAITERMQGTNKTMYHHMYYAAIDHANVNNQHNVDAQEIGRSAWFTYDSAIKNMRPYHIQKKHLLTRVYMFFINQIIDMHTQCH